MIERLLRSHFVRRFLDNELISPDADRHELLSTISAVLTAGGLCLTLLMGGHYLSLLFQSPARTAVPALDNRFFLFGCSMILMALAALAGWNALSLDARDVAILGPLPIERSTIARAKLSAVAIVASAFALALNAVTSVFFPIMVVAKLPVSARDLGTMVLAHVLVSLAAGAFGFLAVLALREGLHAAIGTKTFARVSPFVHASLAILAIASLLLLPGLSMNVAQRWLAVPDAPRWALPPLWFVGLNEYFISGIMTSLPHQELPRFVIGVERRLADIYALSLPTFAPLARLAVVSLAAVGVPGISAHWWNNRRAEGSSPSAGRTARSRRGRVAVWVVGHAVARRPAGQAGFWLAWQCVTRSLPHRLSMAAAAALGIASLIVGLPMATRALDADPLPIAALAPQIVTLAALVFGFRHAVGLPADLRANWIIRLAWLGGERQYVAGVRRFAIVGILGPAALSLIPVHALVLGLERACLQAAFGLLLSMVLLQTIMVGLERLPFAMPHEPSGKLKTHGPVYLFAGIFGLVAVAALERALLQTPLGFAVFAGIAVAAYLTLGAVAGRARRLQQLADFDALPQETTQRLGLV